MTLKEAREKRGWTYYEACQRMERVGEQSLKDLEWGVRGGSRTRVWIMLEIIRVYWPDVSLADFLGVREPELDLRLTPRNQTAERRLLRGR